MLSIEKLKTAQKASDYYQEENYYAKEGESLEGKSLQGIWVGKGAEMLNLRGNASVEQFKAVLEGKLSPEILMENVKQGKYHRPGYDLTFSAPKSVSILAVLAQDKDILNAHRTAIAGVLKHLEAHYAGTRRKKQGKTTIEQTGNLIMCTFEHNDSRMLDPNLHTHIIIMNAVLRSDNRWRTLFSEAFYEDKITLGMHYRALLASELMKLGFEIEQTSEKGTFEIKDFPEILIKQLSKRRAQIEAYMEEHGLKGAEAAKIANFNTRPNKQKVDPEHLTLAWAVELMQHGYSIEWLQNFCNDAKTRGPIAPPDPILLAKQSLDLAVRHLSIFQPVFSLQELKKATMGLSILNHSSTLLQQSIETQFKKGELLYLGNQLCTTQIARDTEIENAAALRLDKNQVHPLFSPLASKYAISKSGLNTQSQKEALSFLLKSPDRQIAIQYENKKDQSLLMSAYLKAIQHHGLYPLGLTQEPVRVEPFAEALGLERVQTIEGFLIGCGFRAEELRLQAANPNQPLAPQVITSKRSPNFGKLKKPARIRTPAALKNAREIWILDASSSISLLQVRQLQGYATQFGARIIWAHHPFKKQSAIRSLIQHGISHIALSGSAKTPLGDWLKQKEIVKSFEYLVQQQKITAISDRSARQSAAVARYLKQPESVLVSTTHFERKVLNEAVRVAKNLNGELKGEPISVQSLQPVSLSMASKSVAKFYQLNDVVRFNEGHEALGIGKGDYLTVTDIHQKNKRLTLTDTAGKTYSFKLTLDNVAKCQVYRPEARDLQINDIIVWNETRRDMDNRELDRLKHERATVLSLSAESVEVNLKSNQIVCLNPNQLTDRHWDYGYACTLEGGSKIESKAPVLVLNSQASFLNYHALLKIMSEAAEELHVFCDHGPKTAEMLLRQSSTEALALDHAVRHYNIAEAEKGSSVDVAKEFFPKLNARLDGLYAEHKDLLTEIMHTIDAEQQQKIAKATAVEPLSKSKAEISPSEHQPCDSNPLSLLKEGALTSTDVPAPIEISKAPLTTENKAITQSASELLQREQEKAACHAIDWLSLKYAERNAVFLEHVFSKELFQLEGLRIPEEILSQQLNFAFKAGVLIQVEDAENPTEARMTTKETLLLEKACIYLAEQAKNQTTSLLLPEAAPLLALKQEALTDGQKAAIELVLTSSDRVVGIQGISGAGKTTMLKILNVITLRDTKREILGLSNSTQARQRLEEGAQDLNASDMYEQAGIRTLTTRKFLMNCTRLLKKGLECAKAEYGGVLIVLDEASFTSTREMFYLLHLIQKLDAKLVIMGDNKQLNSVEAGRILYLLLGSRINIVAMTENVRLKEYKALKMLQHLYKQEIGEALQTLGSSIVEIADRTERLQYIANHYLQKTPAERENSLIVTPLNKDRREVNACIHKGLRKSQELSGQEYKVAVLTPIDMTQAEKEKVYYFKPGDWIRFNQNAIGVSIRAGEYCKIVGKKVSDQVLILERSDKTRVLWSLDHNVRKDSGAIEVYQLEKRDIMVNEHIRWLKNNEKRGIRNGEMARIISLIKDEKAGSLLMTVRLKDGLEQALHLSEHSSRHWDYAYASTTYAIQGWSKPDTILHGIGGFLKISEGFNVGDVLLHQKSILEDAKDTITPSTWVRIVSVNGQNIRVQDRVGKIFELKDVSEWQCYENPEHRKLKDLPKITTLEDLLVALSRGDKATLVTDNLDAYRHTLISKLNHKRSAQEYCDPEREKVRAKVRALTENVTGRAKKPIPEQNIKERAHQTEASFSSAPKNRFTSQDKERFFIDQFEVIARLHSDILGYATRWLGDPKRKNGRTARWEGALEVVLSGTKAGSWKRWTGTGKGGRNLISLYMDHYELDYKTALKELADALGIQPLDTLSKEAYKIREKENQETYKVAMEKQNKIEAAANAKRTKEALSLYNKCRPIAGTLAEKYLREFRGIKGAMPEDFRFIAATKHKDTQKMTAALVAPIRNSIGEIQSIVRIFVDKDGQKLKATYINQEGEAKKAAEKLNLGSMQDAGVVINSGKSHTSIYIAEGLETALSVKEAMPDKRILASLSVSHMQNMPISEDTQKVVICADEDGQGASSNQSVVDAANAFLKRGFKVEIAYPTVNAALSKTDFNDLLKISGVKAIEQDFKQVITVREPLSEQKLLQLKSELSVTKEQFIKHNGKERER